MEIYVLNEKLDRIGTVDIYESFIWSPSYNQVGSWQLNCPLRYFDLLQADRIIQCTQDEEHNGIIEDIQKITDENGDESLVVKGRMLEAILERRVILGTTAFDFQQPAEILRQIIRENVINPVDQRRKISDFEIEGSPKADYGVVSYAAAGDTVLGALENICQEALLGFALRVDSAQRKYIMKLYKGSNYTLENNLSTSLEEREIAHQLITNWDFSAGLSGWSVTGGGSGIGTVSGGVYGRMVRKQKVWERYRDEITKERYAYPLSSGYLNQKIDLQSSHIYYLAVRCNNPTEHDVGFGILTGGACTFTLKKKSFEEHTALYVPSKTDAYTWALGVGNLSDEPGGEGEYLLIDYSLVVDLTETFGAGKEPDLAWCQENMYYKNGKWRYKLQKTEHIPNHNDPLVFSRERDVLLEVEYSKISLNERNQMYVQGDGVAIVLGDDAQGVFRKEVFLDLSNVKREQDGITIPEASYLAMLRREGAAALKRLQISELVDGRLYSLANVVYRTHYRLGDMVICQDSKIGFETNLRITAVEEVWDTSGYKLSLIFGEDIPDITETIKLVTKGAK